MYNQVADTKFHTIVKSCLDYEGVNFLKTIIFIGTNKSGSSRDAIKAAVRLGYFTVLFTNKEKQIAQRKEYTDVHEMIFIDTSDMAAMADAIRSMQSKGNEIMTIISFIDPNVSKALALCDMFCPNGVSSKAAALMENKAGTRALLEKHSSSPAFFIINPEDEWDFDDFELSLGYNFPDFPVIVKSSSSTGSKDVIRVTDHVQLQKQVRKLREKAPEESVIIEEFIEGQQYLVEALVYERQIMIAGIIQQEITFGKRFIITGYGVMSKVPKELENSIRSVLTSIMQHFAIENGAFHIEMRLTKKGWRLIEINPRISGGAMNQMLKAAFGFDLAEETVKLYLGEQPSIVPAHRTFIFTQYVIVNERGILEKVTGKGRAKKTPGVVEVYVKPKKGTLLMPPLSMGHRYAYVIATGETLSAAKKTAKQAAKEIHFHFLQNS